MRRFPSRSEVTIPSRPSARDELRRVLRADADQRAAPLRPPRRGDLRAELVQPLDQPRVELVHVLARVGDADLLHQLDPGDARVDRGDRRRARLEAARGRRRRVVAVVHLEDVLVREPAGRGRPDALDDARAARTGSARPAEPSRYLRTPAREEVDVELAHVERERAGALVRVEQDERAALVRDARDLARRRRARRSGSRRA